MATPDRSGTGGSRPLPPHPDIAFEKKRAKRLLRSARAGERDAVESIERVAAGAGASGWTLALAQLAVAREYGFASWPKLAAYFTRAALLVRAARPQMRSLEFHQSQVQGLRSNQAKHVALYGQMIATHLPRLYGKSNADVFASPITEDEARFIVARQHGCADWAELTQRAVPDPYAGLAGEERRVAAKRESERRRAVHRESPAGRAGAAIRASHLADLVAIVDAHPDLLAEPANDTMSLEMSLASQALDGERSAGTAEAREIVEWLSSRGANVHDALDRRLLFGPALDPPSLAYWLARGANPDRAWPTGYSTIEHALVWYNIGQSRPELVDTLLKHVDRLPQALWVAAGTGDVAGVRRYFERGGRLKPAARRRRPDFDALGIPALPFNPDADDETVVYEAAWVAVLNGRAAVLDALIDRGLAVDAAPFNATLLHMAVGCGSEVSVKRLLERGANADAPQLYNRSPRWLAQETHFAPPAPPERERIAALFRSLPASRSGAP